MRLPKITGNTASFFSTTRRRCHIGWRLAALTLVLAFAAHPPHVQAQILSGYKVEIVGAGQLDALLKANLTISRHAEDSDTALDELERLVAITPQQITDLLATEGYFSPRVSGNLEHDGDSYTARFQVELQAPVVIAGADIRFSGDIATRAKEDPRSEARIERLKRQWGLGPGQRFRQAEWSSSKNTLLKGLINQDYPAARIADSEARIDPAARRAELSVAVDSGPAFTFGELQVHGLERYPDRTVVGLNPIRPGDPYSQDKLNELQARLQNSGYFKSAFAAIDVDPQHPERVPVRVDVTENERKRLSLGVGFSTDAGARLQARYLDRLFLGRDLRLESNAKIDRQTRAFGGDVYFPPIYLPLVQGWIPSVGAHYERTDIANVVNNKLRSSAMLTSPDRIDERAVGLSYLADRQQIEGLPVNNRQALVAMWNATRRRLDNLLDPRRGYVASLELAAGPKGLVNQQNIARALGKATVIYPLAPRWHTVFRGQVGQVFLASRENVPEDLLFRTGGDQTVRGYGYQTLGVSDNGAVVGGRVFALASAEVVYQFTPQWGAALFHDAGNAADTWRDFHFAHGTGAGARWRSPIGPVNLDVAFAHETRKPRLHFSLGYGF
jgi:translocation and assembly module TamA